MASLRPSRATYIAAFILGALIALLLVRPARSAETYRLDRIGVVGFTEFGTAFQLDGNRSTGLAPMKPSA